MPTPYEILRTELTSDPLARGYAGMTATQAATSLNTANRPTAVLPALFTPSQIINQIVPADLAALATTTNQPKLNALLLVLQGSVVDASLNSTVRETIKTVFAGTGLATTPGTTLNRLGNLVAPYDTPGNMTRAAEIGWPTDVPLTSLEVTYARNLS